LITPEREVKVVAPVKFIAKNEDAEGIRISHDIKYRSLYQGDFMPYINEKNKRVKIIPVIQPLRAKALPGIQGRKRGVIKAPRKRAVI